MKDLRPDELLEECGRIAFELGLKLAWTDGLEGAAAKTCSRGGSANWKRARVLADEAHAAVALFRTRARKRNPVVPAAANELLIVEVDLDIPDDVYLSDDEVEDRVDALLESRGIAFPETTSVRSRRGRHFYLRLPAGCAAVKVQIDDSNGIAPSKDGYVVGAPGLHELEGIVYRYVHNGRPALCPRRTYELLVERGKQTRKQAWADFKAGEPISRGWRNETIFHAALERVRAGEARSQILERLLEVNREQCRPPLEEALVGKQLEGARKWAREHPTEVEKAGAKAHRILGERHLEAQPKRQRGKRLLLARRVATVRSRPISWLVPGMIPLGALTLVAGIGGLGKSTWLMSIAGAVSSGKLGAPGGVLIVSYEDPVDMVLRPRLVAAGANLELVSELYVEVDDIAGIEGVVLPSDLPALERQVEDTGARMVVLDPIVAAVDISLDAHKDQHVRHVLAQLTAIAERRECAIPIVGHLNKAPTSDAYLRVANSTAFWNASRSVVLLTADPASDDDTSRLVAQRKTNWARSKPVQRWRLESVLVNDSGHELETSRIVFVEDADDIDPETILQTDRTGREQKTTQAAEWLRAALADGDWHERGGLAVLAAAVGISDRTLKRAAHEELQVEHERRGYPSTTWWRLSQSGQGFPRIAGPTGDPA
jgi:RecA-family ATPase